MAEKELILDIPLEHEMNILGDMDKYLRKLQRQFSVNIIDRDGLLKIIGEEENAEKTKGSSFPFKVIRKRESDFRAKCGLCHFPYHKGGEGRAAFTAGRRFRGKNRSWKAGKAEDAGTEVLCR